MGKRMPGGGGNTTPSMHLSPTSSPSELKLRLQAMEEQAKLRDGNKRAGEDPIKSGKQYPDKQALISSTSNHVNEPKHHKTAGTSQPEHICCC